MSVLIFQVSKIDKNVVVVDVSLCFVVIGTEVKWLYKLFYGKKIASFGYA